MLRVSDAYCTVNETLFVVPMLFTTATLRRVREAVLEMVKSLPRRHRSPSGRDQRPVRRGGPTQVGSRQSYLHRSDEGTVRDPVCGVLFGWPFGIS
jgi:hypothetical protein